MNTKQVYHYVYRITNKVEGKHYYGKRSSKIPPKSDIGIKYFSSSTDKAFILDQKQNPENYKYKIISLYPTAKLALEKEIKLHNKFLVSTNSHFYNKMIQTSTKFDSTGVPSPMKGKIHSTESKHKMAKAKKGIYTGNNANNAKQANLYNYTTGEIIAEKVVIVEWCKTNPAYTPSALYSTASCDRLLPSSAKNKHHHKNICALYISDKDFVKKEVLYSSGSLKYTKNTQNIDGTALTLQEKISKALKGKSKTQTHIENLANARTKLVDIRIYETDELVASRVKVNSWCKENGYSYSKLYETLKSDKNLPHHYIRNPRHHKLIYAEYSAV